MSRLHRNNAAEWVMVAALMPFAWIVRGWKKLRGSRPAENKLPVKKPVRSSVMIEGLPPRTLN